VITAVPSITGYHFGDFELDRVRGCLLRNGRELPLRYQSYQLLLYFVEHRETLISKDELTGFIWGDTSVTDNALVQCVAEIRHELGDDRRDPHYIKTFSKVGYRFIAPVTVIHAEHENEVAASHRQARTESSHPKEIAQRHVVHGSWRRVLRLLPALLLTMPLLLASGDEAIQWRPVNSAAISTSGLPVLAVFPLANGTGREEMNWLREGLSDMILTDLAHMGRWNVLSREKMHSLVDDSSNSSTLSLDKSLAIARSIHATNFVVGAVSSSGSQVTILIEIHDGQDGHLVASDSASLNDPSEIVAEAGLLSTSIARRLGFYSENAPPLAQIMTSNIEAYRYYSLGVEKAEQFQNAQAIELFKKALKFDPRFAMAYARIGYAYSVQDFQPETGRPYLEQALSLSASLPAINQLYIQSWYAIARSDYNAAIATLRQITEQYPQETEADCELGRVLRGQERVEEAVALLRHAIQLNPDARELYNVLGTSLTSMQRYPEAIEAYRQYVALAPSNPNAYDSLGMGYQQAGQYDAAIAEDNQALQLDPEFEPSIVHLGDTYYQMGRYGDALREYKLYIEVTSSRDAKAIGYGDIATVYRTMNQLKDAQQAAAQELSYNRNSVWDSLDIALDNHQTDRAEILERALFANPPNPERGAARDLRTEFYERGTIALKTGDAQAALGNFKSALEHLPPTSGIDMHEDCLANAYLQLSMFPEAIAEYQRILKFNFNYPLVYFHLGQAYQRAHQRPQAIAAYEHFLESNPTADQNSPPVLETRRALALGVL
jgi:tetratricopeptide (TPR) repeat protein/DNA-binding winged helix-turn-helix (wHTH) protein/TolB-like protein